MRGRRPREGMEGEQRRGMFVSSGEVWISAHDFPEELPAQKPGLIWKWKAEEFVFSMPFVKSVFLE